MNVSIIIFGQLRDIIGSSNIVINDVADTNELQNELQLRYPALANAKYAIAVDKKLVSQNTAVSDNSTIALLPPFSGG